ncbi:aromatic ring-hydroxylating oxygenase subunit alpha [Streptomyces altiplanensis]
MTELEANPHGAPYGATYGTRHPRELDELLRELGRVARLPLERSETLPTRAYTSPEFFALEKDLVFRRDWLCVGRAEEVARPGDYLRVDVLDEPLVVTRDEGGELHALSRVCRHRFMDVLPAETTPERGNLPRLKCPYHTWTYRLNGEFAGRLAGAPLMNKVEFDRGACRLPGHRVEVWNGFVMINSDPGAAPLAPQLAGLDEKLAPYGLGELTLAHKSAWEAVPANWKVAMENGSENYHHMGTHAATLEPVLPGRNTEIDECEGGWFTMHTPFAPEAAAFLAEERDPAEYGAQGSSALVPGIAGDRNPGMLVAGIFPNLVLVLLPDSVTSVRWMPTGPTSHDAILSVLVPAGARGLPGFDAYVQRSREQLEAIQAEDLVAVRGVQRGLAADPAPSAGRFSHLERPLWQFQRYLAGRLTGPGEGRGARPPAQAC